MLRALPTALSCCLTVLTGLAYAQGSSPVDSVSAPGYDELGDAIASGAQLCGQGPFTLAGEFTASNSPVSDCFDASADGFYPFVIAEGSNSIGFELGIASCSSGSAVDVEIVDANGTRVSSVCLTGLGAGDANATIRSVDVQPGERYALRINGVAGATCTVTIEGVIGELAAAPAAGTPPRPQLTSPVCWGSDIALSTGTTEGAVRYVWTFRQGVATETTVVDASGAEVGPRAYVSDGPQLGILSGEVPSAHVPGTCDTLFATVRAIGACDTSAASEPLALVFCSEIVDRVQAALCINDTTGFRFPDANGRGYFYRSALAQSAPAPGAAGCNAVVAINIEQLDGGGADTVYRRRVCTLPTELEGEAIPREGLYAFGFPTDGECDSVAQYRVYALDEQGFALDSLACLGERVDAGGASDPASGFDFAWTDAAGAPAGASPDGVANTFATAGTYTLTISGDDCERVLTTTVRPAVGLAYAVVGDTLVAYGTAGVDSFAAQVYAGDEVVAYPDLDTLRFPLGGQTEVSFTYVLTDGACGAVVRDSIVLELGPVGTSTARRSERFALRAFPNPARTSLGVALPGEAVYALALVDAFGRRVLDVTVAAGERVATVPVEGLPRGTYVLVARGAAGAVVARTRVVLH